jgi:antitoxin ParD1/3/4
MEISLPKELQEMVQQKVESGQYNSTSEVIVDALWLLHYQDRLREIKLEELRAEIQKGLDSGPSISGEEFFSKLREKARKRVEQEK